MTDLNQGRTPAQQESNALIGTVMLCCLALMALAGAIGVFIGAI